MYSQMNVTENVLSSCGFLLGKQKFHLSNGGQAGLPWDLSVSANNLMRSRYSSPLHFRNMSLLKCRTTDNQFTETDLTSRKLDTSYNTPGLLCDSSSVPRAEKNTQRDRGSEIVKILLFVEIVQMQSPGLALVRLRL